jgi:hypothetical protein
MTRISGSNSPIYTQQDRVSERPDIKALLGQIKSKKEDFLDLDLNMVKAKDKPNPNSNKPGTCSTAQYLRPTRVGGQCFPKPTPEPKPQQPAPNPKPK